MKANNPRQRRYPFNIGRVFLNAITSVLSTFLAFMFLSETLLLPYFVLATSIVTAIAFILKIRPVIKVPKYEIGKELKNNDVLLSRRRSLMLVASLIAALVFPFLVFLSARIFEPTVWFTVIASIASGIGISEIFFYIYCQKR